MPRLDRQAREASRVAGRVHALLRGRGPAMQGAILADAVALFIAGHIDPDSVETTEAVRSEQLALLLQTIMMLVPVNDALLRAALSGVEGGAAT